MTLALFSAAGRPRTKGSLKAYCMKDRRHTMRVEEEVAESKSWRATVAKAAREYQLSRYGRIIQHPGPVEVRLVFFFPREESVNGGPIPTHATPFPTAITLGDTDKLERNVLDALITPRKRAEARWCSGLLADDSQVVKLSALKLWADDQHLAGVHVMVEEMETPAEHLEAEGSVWRLAQDLEPVA